MRGMLAKRGRAERRDLERDVAPAGRLEPFGAACLLDDVPEPGLTQEAHRETRAGCVDEPGPERQQHSGAVTRDAVGGPRAAVRHSGQTRKSPVEQLPGRAPTGVGDQADATGITLEGAPVEKRLGAQGSPPSGILNVSAFRFRGTGEQPPAGVSVS